MTDTEILRAIAQDVREIRTRFDEHVTSHITLEGRMSTIETKASWFGAVTGIVSGMLSALGIRWASGQ